IECFRIEVNTDDACFFGRLKNRFAVSTESNRTIYEEPSSFWDEEFHCLFQQHGAMGRAYAPQRRSHHHRPVISFKDLSKTFELCRLNFVLCIELRTSSSLYYQRTKYK